MAESVTEPEAGQMTNGGYDPKHPHAGWWLFPLLGFFVALLALGSFESGVQAEHASGVIEGLWWLACAVAGLFAVAGGLGLVAAYSLNRE